MFMSVQSGIWKFEMAHCDRFLGTSSLLFEHLYKMAMNVLRTRTRTRTS